LISVYKKGDLRMKKLAIAVAIICAPLSGYAAPVHLSCNISSKDKPEVLSVILDESSDKVTYSDGNGREFKTDGIFLADRISFEYVLQGYSGIGWVHSYNIDRTNLEMSVNVLASSQLVEHKSGSCKIVKAKKRKI
jgi:hypothetical protein